MSNESVMPFNHLILCCPLLLLPSIFPRIRVFSNESALRIRWPHKYWSFSFNISPSSEHPGLISFRTDWLDLLAVQGTLKSLFQYHSSKASILRRPAFFTVTNIGSLPRPPYTYVGARPSFQALEQSALQLGKEQMNLPSEGPLGAAGRRGGTLAGCNEWVSDSQG